MKLPRTLSELEKSGYAPQSIKAEMRTNLIEKIKKREVLFPDIVGYEDTVIPEIENAILSGHDMMFLGERGQAKTVFLLCKKWHPYPRENFFIFILMAWGSVC
jgi:hypothetical protein